MKRKTIICLFILLFLLITTGCSKKIDYNSKLKYIEEKNKLDLYLYKSNYAKQNDSYYIGEGFECDPKSKYAKKYVGELPDGKKITYYYCINTANERSQKYYQITPSTFEFRFFSNLDIQQLINKANPDYPYNDEEKSFNLNYSVFDNRIEGTYQEKSSSSKLSTYYIDYNYNTESFSCLDSEESNDYEKEDCYDEDNEEFKIVVDEFKNKIDEILKNSNIDLNKVKEYLEQKNEKK